MTKEAHFVQAPSAYHKVSSLSTLCRYDEMWNSSGVLARYRALLISIKEQRKVIKQLLLKCILSNVLYRAVQHMTC